MKVNNLEQIKKQRYENLLRTASNQLQMGKHENAKKTYKRALSLEFNYAEILIEILKIKQKDRLKNEVFKEILVYCLDYQNNGYFNISRQDSKVFSNLSHKKLIELFINAIKLLKPNYFFDIGSYDGSASIKASKALPTLKAIAFEANINNYSNWKDREEFKQLSINYQYQAISNYNGVISFNIPVELKHRKLPKNHGVGSLMLRADPSTKYQVTEVKCMKLDDFCLENNIDLDDEHKNIALWIDVEGAAMQVLEGCSKCLSKTSLIFIEVEEYGFWQDSALADDIIHKLASHNFVPIARDYEYHRQHNLLFVNFNKISAVNQLIHSFYSNLQILPNKISSDDMVFKKRRTSTQALEIIKMAITERKPFSFIRIGDGEAKILGANRDVADEMVNQITETWWKQKITHSNTLELLRMELLKSINSADMLGLFDPALDSNHLLMESKFLLSGKMVRKYCDLNSTHSFVSASEHLNWHNQNLIAGLVDGQEIITLITCRDIASKVADKFKVKTVIWLPIPAEAKYADWQEIGYYHHYPTRMQELLDQIKPLCRGHLFLVGAGILGKIYCRIIKERGGIALDLGSVFDNWAGHTKRPSVRKNRIGV